MAIEVYRAQFRPSDQLDRPYVMLGFNVIAAGTDEEAGLLVTLAATGGRQPAERAAPAVCRRPAAGFEDRLGPAERAMIEQVLSSSAVVRATRSVAVSSRSISRNRRRRADHHVADLRPRGAPPVVRDHSVHPRRRVRRPTLTSDLKLPTPRSDLKVRPQGPTLRSDLTVRP